METDLELLSAAKGMDKDALVKIFELYASPLYNYALRLCRDPESQDETGRLENNSYTCFHGIQFFFNSAFTYLS